METRLSPFIIELSAVYFYHGCPPQTIALKECGLQASGPEAKRVSGFYGNQGKQEGFLAAKAYADKHRLRFEVVDFLVRLDHKQKNLKLNPEDLPCQDFVSFQRLSREIVEKLQEEAGLTATGAISDPAFQQELAACAMRSPAWEHVKVFSYPELVLGSDRPLAIGSVPFRHWDSIVQGSCRLNPDLRVTLERPSDGDPPKPHCPSSPALPPRKARFPARSGRS
jgi:hypothetical protein